MIDDSPQSKDDSQAQELLNRFLSEQPGGGRQELEAWAAGRTPLAGDSELLERLRRCLDAWIRADELAAQALPWVGEDSSYRPAGAQRRSAGRGGDGQAPGDGPAEGTRIAHFTLRRFIAKGGMGQVWEAWDEELRRAVALKLVLPERIDARSLALFAREAHAGGRLAHPSIVTTLGHGSDGGRAWIAQELVEGSWTLKDFLDELRAADAVPKGYYARVAGLVAQLADALQAAHAARVLHRDVKPQNILIAPDQTPKLTDFGLARVIDDSFLSFSGDIAGTYAYMSPEQVTAKRMGLDHRTDIFSLGIVLYELLSLRRPFEGDTTHQIAAKIITFDPPEPSKIRSQCPRELSIIAGKALEKDPDRRYQTMAELAADLRRHLANEPIHARPPGPITRAFKWSKRNPAISSSGAVALLALVVVSGMAVELARSNVDLAAQTELADRRAEETAEQARVAEANATRAEANARIAEENARIAEANAESARLAQLEAEHRTADVLSLSAQKDLDDLVAEAATLWPPHPEMLPRYERWLADARLLLEGRPAAPDQGLKARPSLADHRAKLTELRSRSIPETDPDRLSAARSHARYAELETLRAGEAEPAEEAEPGPQNRAADLLALEIEVGERTFVDPEDGWWHRQLNELVAGIEALHDPKTGLAGDTLAEAFGWGVARRQAFAETIFSRSVEGEEAERLWAEAILAIESSPHYGGLVLTPQMGLLPIGPDPDSGLWEFAHLMSGEVAERGEDGKLLLMEEMGIVLVLIPGGTFWMGAQAGDPEGRNYDPDTQRSEGPPHEVELSPYSLSKYEMTQGQWRRMAGSNPSRYGPPNYALHWNRQRRPADLLHPVESVSWTQSKEMMHWLGLSLPSEAQWERGARGGTDTRWWTGSELASLAGAANLADAYGKAWGGGGWPSWEQTLDDGWTVHAPVGTFTANSFGLHDVAGNVWEWCLDGDAESVYPEKRGKDPVVPWEGFRLRASRGGGFASAAFYARSACRSSEKAEGLSADLGLRPSRVITP